VCRRSVKTARHFGGGNQTSGSGDKSNQDKTWRTISDNSRDARLGEVMLVITRKVGERLVIGDNIEIVVCKITPTRILIGVEAPREIQVKKVDDGK
jgi:Global regulator protein family